MPFDIRKAMEDMKGALSRGDAELHKIWDDSVPALDKAAELGARLADSPLSVPLEAALGLPPQAHDTIANVMSTLVTELGKVVPPAAAGAVTLYPRTTTGAVAGHPRPGTHGQDTAVMPRVEG